MKIPRIPRYIGYQDRLNSSTFSQVAVRHFAPKPTASVSMVWAMKNVLLHESKTYLVLVCVQHNNNN